MDDRLTRLGFEALPVAAMIVDEHRTVLEMNSRFVELTGWTRMELLGRVTSAFRGPDTDPRTSNALAEALAAGRSWSGEASFYRSDGVAFWCATAYVPILDGNRPCFVATVADISDTVALRERSEERGESVLALLELAGRLAFSSGRVAVARAVAESVLRLGGRRAAMVVAEGDALRVLGTAGWDLGPDGLEGLEVGIDAADLVEPLTATSIGDHPDAPAAPVWVAPLIRDDEVLGALVVDRSPGDREDDEARVRLVMTARLAATALDNLLVLEASREAVDRDPLTSLLTHDALLRRFTARLDRMPRARHVGMIHLGLDRLRRVNERLGYAAGDRLLQLVADRIRTQLDPDVLVARYGADEFLVAFPHVEDPERLRETVERLDRAIRVPLTLEGDLVYPTATFGRAVRRRGEARSAALATSLLRAADSGMHREKDRQRSRTPDTGEFDLLRLDTDLHIAVEAGQIVAYFQPLYRLSDGRLAGFEALARWLHPDLGPIPPELFIALAEDNGLIHQLGRQMLEQGRRFLLAQDDEALTMHVNASTTQVARGGYAHAVEQAFDSGSPALQRLVIEVTESSLILDYGLVREELQALRRLGVGIAVDDFGSGYSSLLQLQELPATELKIDRALVQRTGVIGTSVLEAVVTLGRSLGLEVVAEGIEELGQLEVLRTLGCDRVQGFLFAPALPARLAAKVAGSI